MLGYHPRAVDRPIPAVSVESELNYLRLTFAAVIATGAGLLGIHAYDHAKQLATPQELMTSDNPMIHHLESAQVAGEILLSAAMAGTAAAIGLRAESELDAAGM